jgi:hypothetical protein
VVDCDGESACRRRWHLRRADEHPGAIYVRPGLRGSNGSAAQPDARGTQTGEPLDCSGADSVEAVKTVTGGHFTVVGSLAGFDGRDFQVDAPGGRVELVLATDADIGGQFLTGDWIAASGRVDGDKWEATEIKLPCSNQVVGAAPPRSGVPTPDASSGPFFPGFTSAPRRSDAPGGGDAPAVGPTENPPAPPPAEAPAPASTVDPGTPPPAAETPAPTPVPTPEPTPVGTHPPTPNASEEARP